MRCNKCGREILDNASFCPHCGNKIGASLGTTITPVVGSKKDSNALLAFVVVVVVVVVIVAGLYIVLTAARQVAKDIVTADVRITVLSKTSSVYTYFSPDSGKEFVQLTVVFENNGDSSLSLASYEFEVEVVGGARYDSTWKVTDTVPASIAPGGSATFTMAFEIPDSAVPQNLVYQALFENEVVAPVP